LEQAQGSTAAKQTFSNDRELTVHCSLGLTRRVSWLNTDNLKNKLLQWQSVGKCDRSLKGFDVMTGRVKRMDPISVWLRERRRLKNLSRMKTHYQADGLGVRNKDTSFLSEPNFDAAWQNAAELNKEGWAKTGKGIPDIRWRAHVCCWAAQNALKLDGDFVECGVHTGLLSLTVAHFVNINATEKRFWLFDTFEGIPIDGLSSEEKELAERHNNEIYFDVFKIAQRNFSAFPRATLVQGIIPQSFEGCDLENISYLSMDLNNALAERKAIDFLWPKLVPGAVIILDDYAFTGYRKQYDMWNEFAKSMGQIVLTLPTGQGLIIRSP
jgi:O-methyltransferase